MAERIPRIELNEGEPAEFFGRVKDLSGRALAARDMVAYGRVVVTDKEKNTEVYNRLLVTREFITDGLVTNDAGYPYKTGYNFQYVIPSQYFQPGGREFRVEFFVWFHTADQGRRRVRPIPYAVHARGIRGKP